ncbi:hypothetical protein NDI45_26020 [Leptolyngbya sp. GB1-A1]
MQFQQMISSITLATATTVGLSSASHASTKYEAQEDTHHEYHSTGPLNR